MYFVGSSRVSKVYSCRNYIYWLPDDPNYRSFCILLSNYNKYITFLSYPFFSLFLPYVFNHLHNSYSLYDKLTEFHYPVAFQAISALLQHQLPAGHLPAKTILQHTQYNRCSQFNITGVHNITWCSSQLNESCTHSTKVHDR